MRHFHSPYLYIPKMNRIIECVPNFSEGKDLNIIKAITDAAAQVEGVKLLDVDPGASTNRTVVTLVGSPEAVIEAAFQAIKMAVSLIDMSKHSGAHPRMGATDVCPLVPIEGVSVEECVQFAHQLAKRVGEELNIPVYLYEYAATTPERKKLDDIRSGEYEGFEQKLLLPEWKPDYGPQVFNAKSGQTVIGVREFLVAYNINLNTKSTKRATDVANDIREKGRALLENGKFVRDEKGEKVMVPGTCKHVKAIGWYIEEYGIAQVSANLTNIDETPVHEVFEAARKSADARGMRVTGSELVGLIPKKCLIQAGKFYLKQQQLSAGVSEEELIHIGVKSLGLDELKPFNPKEKIIEYKMEEGSGQKLSDLTISAFNDMLASDAPAPGGGSVAALVGALGASLGTMVANLSVVKKGWSKKWEKFSNWAEKGQALKAELLFYINEDTAAFNKVMEAFRLPKSTEAEAQARTEAIEKASQYAAVVPAKVMKTAFSAYELILAMAKDGNPNSITDAAVGAWCIHTAIIGAALNVTINLKGIADKDFCQKMVAETRRYTDDSGDKLEEIMAVVEKQLAANN